MVGGMSRCNSEASIGTYGAQERQGQRMEDHQRAMREQPNSHGGGRCTLQNLLDTRTRADRAESDQPGTRYAAARAAVGTPGSLVVQDCQIELAQARGIGDRLDLGDLAVPDGETQDEEQVPTRRHDERHGSVHESRSRSLSTS